MKNLFKFLLALYLVTLSGCAGCSNSVASRGGLVGSYKGTYVVLNQSGGETLDCWILKNAYVEPTEGGSGWRFTDDAGNSIHLGGDVKVMRLSEKADTSKWHEYHSEFENQTYREKFGKAEE